MVGGGWLVAGYALRATRNTKRLDLTQVQREGLGTARGRVGRSVGDNQAEESAGIINGVVS